MFYLEKLKIDKFYLVESPTKIHFHKKFNFLLGKNGTGKTTLLEIIRAFYTLNFDFLSKEDRDFDITAFFTHKKFIDKYFEISCSESHLEENEAEYHPNMPNLNRRKKRSIDIIIHIQEINIYVKYSSNEQFVQFNNEKITLDKQIPEFLLFLTKVFSKLFKKRAINKKLQEDILDILYIWFFNNVSETNFNSEKSIYRFAEGLENEKILFDTRVLFYELKNNDFISVPNSFYDSQLSKSMLNSDKMKKNMRNLSDHLSDKKKFNPYISFVKNDSTVLDYINDSFKTGDIRLNFFVSSIKQESKFIQIDLDKPNYSIILADEVIDYKKLSYGEKRFFLLVHHIMNNRDVLLLDEPINGLHHDFIDKIFDLLNKSDSQIFIANQSPILFDYAEFENGNEFCEKFTFCKLEDKKMIWEDPTEKEIELFMEDYENQFLTTSMILRKLKLW